MTLPENFKPQDQTTKKKTRDKTDFRQKCLHLLDQIKEVNEERYHDLIKMFHSRFNSIHIQKKLIMGFYAQLINELKHLRPLAEQGLLDIQKSVNKSVKTTKKTVNQTIKGVKKASSKLEKNVVAQVKKTTKTAERKIGKLAATVKKKAKKISKKTAASGLAKKVTKKVVLKNTKKTKKKAVASKTLGKRTKKRVS